MAKITISPARRTELINKVVSGQMTIEQAASRYKVPEAFVKKWVEDAGGISPAPTPAPSHTPQPPVSSGPVSTPAPAASPTPQSPVSSGPVSTPAPAPTSKGFLSSNLGLGVAALLVVGTIAGATWYLGRDDPGLADPTAITDPEDVQPGEPDRGGTEGSESNQDTEPSPGESGDNVDTGTGNNAPSDAPSETDDSASTDGESGTNEPPPPADGDPGTSEPPPPADGDPGTSEPPTPADGDPGTSEPPPAADDAGSDTPPKGETDSDAAAPDNKTPLPDPGDQPAPEPPKPNVLSVNILNLYTSGDNTRVKASITNHSPLFLSRYYIYLNAHGSDGEFLGRHFLTTANLGPGKTVFDDALIDDVAPATIQRIVITIDTVQSIENGEAVRRGDDFTIVDVNPDRDLSSLIDVKDPPWGAFSKDDGTPVVLVKHLKNFGERYRKKQVKMLDVKFLGFTDTYIDALPSVKIDTNGLLVTVNKKEREKWFGISVSDQEGKFFHKVMLPKAVFADMFLAYKADGSQRLNIVGVVVELKDVTGDGLVVARVEAKGNE